MTLLFAATFLPSFLIGELSGKHFRQELAGLLPDTFGGLFFFLTIVAFLGLTVDGVMGSFIPDYLRQPIWFFLTGFISGTMLAIVRGLFKPVPEAPPAVLPYRPGHYRPSSALPPVEFDAVRH